MYEAWVQGQPRFFQMREEFAPQGIDKLVPWDLTVGLDQAPKIHLLHRGVHQQPSGQQPSGALTRVRRNVAECSK